MSLCRTRAEKELADYEARFVSVETRLDLLHTELKTGGSPC